MASQVHKVKCVIWYHASKPVVTAQRFRTEFVREQPLKIRNQDQFLTNSSVHSKNTRNKHHPHRRIANLSCFQKGASYSGIRIFNNLPRSITSLRNEKPRLKVALKKFLYAHSFYSVDEFFACTDDMYY